MDIRMDTVTKLHHLQGAWDGYKNGYCNKLHLLQGAWDGYKN